MLCLIVFILSGSRCMPPSPTSQVPKVMVRKLDGKYSLWRDGAPFHIKGASGTSQLQKLQECGGNTIRIWGVTDLGRILDEAQAHNIAVVAGLAMPYSRFRGWYEARANTDSMYSAIHDTVAKYKDHPALLMWCLGNEVNFPLPLRNRAFYRSYNRLLRMIHAVDGDHPVTTTVINLDRPSILNIRLFVRGLDFISMNIFGRLPALQSELRRFAWLWNGPYLIAEWSNYGPWEADVTAWDAPIEPTSRQKAEQCLTIYKEHMPTEDPRFLGAFIFYWGNKQEATHTWFSLFSSEGAASERVNVLQYLWTGKWPELHAPTLKPMQLAGRSQGEDILLTPGSVHSAEIDLPFHYGEKLTIRWELLEEYWYMKEGATLHQAAPARFDSLLATADTPRITFRIPAKEGPYRLFATVSDRHGLYATTNTPFYVVAPR